MSHALRYLKTCATIAGGIGAILTGAICTTAAAEPAPAYSECCCAMLQPVARYHLDLVRIDPPPQLRFSGHAGTRCTTGAKGPA